MSKVTVKVSVRPVESAKPKENKSKGNEQSKKNKKRKIYQTKAQIVPHVRRGERPSTFKLRKNR